MKLSVQRAVRNEALAAILLKRFRTDVDDIPMTEVFRLFTEQKVPEDGVFHSYQAFVKWMKIHPELTVELVDGPRHGTLVLRMDGRAAGFTEAMTGETVWTGEFRPYGDFSYSLDTEVAP